MKKEKFSAFLRFFYDIVKMEKVKELNNSNALVNLLIFYDC